MKLMMVGSDKVYAIENFYKKYLEAQGVEISLFTAQNYFYGYYQKSILNKILYRASLSGIIPKINKLFRQAVEEFKPDIIWLFKGMEITAASLDWAKKKNIRLANYNPDNPFIFSGAGSGNKNVTDSIPLYDLHFTYNQKVKDKLEKELNLRAAYLPFGFDLPDTLYEECAAQEELIRVCFAGNPDRERAAFIEDLAARGLEIDVYGNRWSRFVKHPRIRIFQPVYGNEFWKILRKYRVQLNLMRPHNEYSHNMRSFEVPAVGGIMLAPDTAEHRLFFEAGKEVFLFESSEDCAMYAEKLLHLPKAEADEIRLNARKRSLESGYSYQELAGKALGEIRKQVSLRNE